jgi:membrane protease YdiL (CAAX protease family)
VTSIPPPIELDRDEDEPPPAAEPQDEAFGAWMAPAAIVLGLLLGFVADAVLLAIANPRRITDPGPALNLALNAIFDLGFVAAALWFARTHARLLPSAFGYVRPRWKLATGAIVAGGITYYAVTFVYQHVLTLHQQDKLPDAFGSVRTSTVAFLCAAAFVCVIAPIAEEFFFRGFLFGVLRRWRGPWLAALLTSVLFGAVHAGSAPIEDLIPLGFFGFILCLIRWRTDSLYPGMGLHSLNNALALGITDLKWNAGPVLLLIAGGIGVIGALTLPLSTAPRTVT